MCSTNNNQSIVDIKMQVVKILKSAKKQRDGCLKSIGDEMQNSGFSLETSEEVSINDRTILSAIKERCKLCTINCNEESGSCGYRKCKLYRFRKGENPKNNKKSINSVVVSFCLKCSNVKKMEDFRILDCSNCPLGPWRPGPVFDPTSNLRFSIISDPNED
jgi:hypothetical protein